MEDLLNLLLKTKKCWTGSEEFEIFSNFYEENGNIIEEWINQQFQTLIIKSNDESGQFRKVGNEFYFKKDFKESIKWYTKSLCYAVYNTEEFSLAYANRSAGYFALRQYKSCCSDIDFCLKSNYPIHLRPKVYIRKIQCCNELGWYKVLQETLNECFQFLKENPTLEHRERYLKDLNKYNILTGKTADSAIVPLPEIPELNDANEKFLFASTSVKLSYNTTHGRHVCSTKNLIAGDILFIEKAFIFAPLFQENEEFLQNKCYYCLQDIESCIPCQSCTRCIYCDENCRDNSWKEGHRWECLGMQAGLWCKIGVAYPAFKAMLKGIDSKFPQVNINIDDDVACYGSKIDNYRYFSKLLSFIHDNDNVEALVGTACVISYLERKTTFFIWLQQHLINDSNKFIGGLIFRHIGQLVCNSSIVTHWKLEPEFLLPTNTIEVACGIYPSVSMMNHSCKPNIALYYIQDTIVVAAAKNIPENEEIFNCYGMDYRFFGKQERITLLQKLYCFKCDCEICQNPSQELNTLQSYICQKCKKAITRNFNHCSSCGAEISLEHFDVLSKRAENYLKNVDIQNLTAALGIRKSILHRYHEDLENCYRQFFKYYMMEGNLNEALIFFKKFLKIVKRRMGKNSQYVGIQLYEFATVVTQSLKNKFVEEIRNYQNLIKEIMEIMQEVKTILKLYYPQHLLHFASVDSDLLYINRIICI